MHNPKIYKTNTTGNSTVFQSRSVSAGSVPQSQGFVANLNSFGSEDYQYHTAYQGTGEDQTSQRRQGINPSNYKNQHSDQQDTFYNNQVGGELCGQPYQQNPLKEVSASLQQMMGQGADQNLNNTTVNNSNFGSSFGSNQNGGSPRPQLSTNIDSNNNSNSGRQNAPKFSPSKTPNSSPFFKQNSEDFGYNQRFDSQNNPKYINQPGQNPSRLGQKSGGSNNTLSNSNLSKSSFPSKNPLINVIFGTRDGIKNMFSNSYYNNKNSSKDSVPNSKAGNSPFAKTSSFGENYGVQELQRQSDPTLVVRSGSVFGKKIASNGNRPQAGQRKAQSNYYTDSNASLGSNPGSNTIPNSNPNSNSNANPKNGRTNLSTNKPSSDIFKKPLMGNSRQFSDYGTAGSNSKPGDYFFGSKSSYSTPTHSLHNNFGAHKNSKLFNTNQVRINAGGFSQPGSKPTWIQNITKHLSVKRTPFLIVSVLLVYTIIGFGFGFFVFNGGEKDAKAGEVNFVSAAIKIESPKTYKIGDRLEITLTVQNASSNKSINGVSLEMISTKNSIRWIDGERKDGSKVEFQDQILNLDNLYNSERIEYKITGTLQRNDFDILFLLGKVRYFGNSGVETVETNRAFTEVRKVKKDLQTYLLSSQKTYKTGESASIVIKKPSFEDVEQSPNSGSIEIEGQAIDLQDQNNSEEGSQSPSQETGAAVSNSSNILNSTSSKSVSSATQNTDSAAQSSSLDSSIGIESDRIQGTLFVSSQEKTVEYTCDTDQDCVITTNKLSDGNYSAVFTSKNGFYYSQIQKFVVGEGKTKASLGPQADLVFPLGTSSYNGIIPFRIENAISLNREFDPEFECEIEIWQNDNKISERKVVIDSDRVCKGNLDITDFKNTGVYEVRLLGVDRNKRSVNQAVIFGGSKSSDINLKNISEKTEMGNNVQIQIDGLFSPKTTQPQSSSSSSSPSSSSSSSSQLNEGDTSFITFEIASPSSSSQSSQASQPSQSQMAQRDIVQDGVAAEVKIYHPNTGHVESIKSLDGKILQTQNQTFFANIPASYFQKGGLYQVLVTFESGLNSSFLNLDMSSQDISYIDSGISYDMPVAGKKITFNTKGLRSKDGSLVDSKECIGKLYLAKKNTEKIKSGKVEQGVCNITFDENQTKIAGPAVVEIQGFAQNIEIIPSEAANYGQFSLEYSPAKVDNGNTVIIGPVVDASGNLTSVKNLTLNVRNKDNQSSVELDGKTVDTEQQENSNQKNAEPKASSNDTLIKSFSVDIENGFAEIFVPSSIFSQEGNLLLELKDPNSETGKPILEKQIFVEKNDKKILTPNRIGTLSSDKNLNLQISGLTGDYLTSDVLAGNCRMRIYKTIEDMREVEAEYDRQNGSCSFDWEGSGYRDRNFLLELNMDKYQYHQLVSVESGQANTVFEVLSSNRYISQDRVLPRLVTTPIFDTQGVPVSNQKLRWRLNRRTFETEIQQGFSKLELTSDKLENQDIRESQLGKTLNIDLDATASTLSTSKTNTINSFLGGRKISDKAANIQPLSYQNHIASVEDKIFIFESNSCDFVMLPTVSSESITQLSSARIGKNCLVQIPRSTKTGNYSVLAKENGFEVESFDLKVTASPIIIQWCKSSPCDINLYGGFQGQMTAQILDGNNVYKFINKDMENTVNIVQKDLDKLQKYRVLIEFETEKGKSINYKEILGEYLVG